MQTIKRVKDEKCKMTNIKTAYGTSQVAENKLDCISNIINTAQNQGIVSRIVLFGSATTNRCRKDSDIDIAIFGAAPKSKMLRSKDYKDLLRSIRHFDKIQTYDILYFNQKQSVDVGGAIGEAIQNGITLYDKQVGVMT